MKVLQEIIANAKRAQKRIVLPEGLEPRTLRAADIILKEGIARLIILGNPAEVRQEAEKLGVNLTRAVIVDPATEIGRASCRERV